MNRVPVISKDNIALMPTKPSKARKLVRDGKAISKWNKLGQYYIQLTIEPSGSKTQPISAGIDPGKLYSGIGLQSSRFTLFTKTKVELIQRSTGLICTQLYGKQAFLPSV